MLRLARDHPFENEISRKISLAISAEQNQNRER
jgi:hypothetical protein